MPIAKIVTSGSPTRALLIAFFALILGGHARGMGEVHFPLRIEPGARYLSDASGKPFLIQGDAAWSLIAQLTREEAEQYLADRKARGFNTLLVSLIEHQFSRNAPANAYHAQPFTKPNDFSTPNEQYFAHADWVLKRAADYGFLVLLAPSYVGAGGGGQGWFMAMMRNGPDRLRDYGRFLGQRYRAYSNIIWVHGGDDCPSDKIFVRAIAEGIESSDPQSLNTAHCSRDTSPFEFWRGESWLQINTLYTYGSVLAGAQREYAQAKQMPYFLIEAVYENEHSAGEQFLRMQAYQALLTGAAGQVFGNNPIWHFGSGGLYSTSVTWKEALNGRGSQSMSHIAELFNKLPWWKLEPDIAGRFLKKTQGSEGDVPFAAVTDDHRLAVVYTSSLSPLSVDLTLLGGSPLVARWFDPASGTFSPFLTLPSSPAGPTNIQPTGRNSSGTTDWVLIVEASP